LKILKEKSNKHDTEALGFRSVFVLNKSCQIRIRRRKKKS